MQLLRLPELALLVVVAATAVFVADAIRRRGQPALIAVGTFSFASAISIFALAVLHTAAVLSRPLTGRGVGDAASFTYDFRFYALLLVGFSLLVPSFLVLLRARGLTRGEREAWKTAMWSNVVLVAVNGPMIPVQKFAILLGSLAAASLIVLGISRRRFQGR